MNGAFRCLDRAGDSRWRAQILEFIEQEEELLPTELVTLVKEYTDLEHAKVEAKGVADNRVQNLTVTLNKAAYVLSHENQHQGPPLRTLTPEVRKPGNRLDDLYGVAPPHQTG